MSQSEGFNNSRRDNVCLLKKSLYGLKQSLRQWYKRFDSFMVSNGYIRNQFDNCVYSKKVFEESYVYLLLYVDDMLIAAKNMAVINNLKALLKSEFEMKDLGAVKKILGIEIWHDRKAGRLWISQEKYIEKVLQAFFVDQSKSVSTPLATHFKLDQSTISGTDKESLENNKTWDLVTLPKGVKPVKYKWVLKRKEGILGVEPARFNARPVAKGFSQKEGIDHHEIFSPVVKHKTIRVLLAMVGAFNLELE
nr:retrovirus-related Pol polyprotein from transposon TNT 1-94 [Tanacetum cinerariifolium]